jgi:glycosyltransferase involved in cell wall biosynthesis
VVTQTRPPDEYVIVDDGSTDRCPRIIEEYATKYPFIRAFRLPTNRGQLVAAKRTFEEACSDYFFGFASDDVVEPGFFARAMAAAERFPDAGVIFGDVRFVDESGQVLGETDLSRFGEEAYLPPVRFLTEFLEAEGPGFSASGSTIYRRKTIEEAGFFPHELGSWADTFTIRAIGLRHGACYVRHRGITWTQRQHGFSQTARSNPKKLIDIMVRGAWLMRSPAYRDLFPEDHVRRWERAFRRWVADDQAERLWHQMLDPFDRQSQALEPLGPADRILIAVTRFLVRLAVKLKSRHTRSKLAAYPGDLSCYDDRAR